MSEYRSLSDYLRIQVPILVAHDRDLRWATRVALRSAQDVVRELSGAGVLEWSATRGWSGPRAVIQRAGLPEGTRGRKDAGAPMVAVADFIEWLKSVEEKKGVDEVASQGFTGGIVVLHDLFSYLEDPILIRGLADLYDLLFSSMGTAVIPLSAPLPQGHPLESYAIQAHTAHDPEKRYGGMAKEIVSEFGKLAVGSSVDEVVKALDGLSVTEAETVCRLIAMDILSMDGPYTGGTLQHRVRDERSRMKS